VTDHMYRHSRPDTGWFRRFLGWCRRLLDWWRDNSSQPTPAPVPEFPRPARPKLVTYREPEIGPVVVRSEGDVFEFHVYATPTWTGQEMFADELREHAGRLTPRVHELVREQIWPLARNFRPTAGAQAEVAFQRAVESGWHFSNGVACVVKLRVLSDPALHEHLRKSALRELDVEADAKLGRLRVELLTTVVDKWHKLLTDLGRTPEAVQAARLTAQDLGTAVQQLAAHHRTAVEELIKVLGTAAGQHDRIGLYEFATAYDAALAALQRELGVTAPAPR
jgi:hypothetical protein